MVASVLGVVAYRDLHQLVIRNGCRLWVFLLQSLCELRNRNSYLRARHSSFSIAKAQKISIIQSSIARIVLKP